MGNLVVRSWNREIFAGTVQVQDFEGESEIEMLPVCPTAWIVCTSMCNASCGDSSGI